MMTLRLGLKIRFLQLASLHAYLRNICYLSKHYYKPSRCPAIIANKASSWLLLATRDENSEVCMPKFLSLNFTTVVRIFQNSFLALTIGLLRGLRWIFSSLRHQFIIKFDCSCIKSYFPAC